MSWSCNRRILLSRRLFLGGMWTQGSRYIYISEMHEGEPKIMSIFINMVVNTISIFQMGRKKHSGWKSGCARIIQNKESRRSWDVRKCVKELTHLNALEFHTIFKLTNAFFAWTISWQMRSMITGNSLKCQNVMNIDERQMHQAPYPCPYSGYVNDLV